MAVSWRITFFKKNRLKPLFYSVFGGARFLGQAVKKGNFWTPPQKKRIFWLITEKLFLWYFCVFLLFLSFVFLFVFLFFVFVFGGFKGSGEMARRATSLGPKPFLILLFVFVVFCFCFFCLFFFGGFKGQVRWPKGPPHLALNPPYLFLYFCFCFFFVPFLSLLLIEKPCFPPKKAFFVYFLCFSFFLPQPFLTSPFFCFSFSVSLLLLSFFLPSCLSFLLSFSFLFLSLVIFLSSLLLFSEKNNMTILNCNLFSSMF